MISCDEARKMYTKFFENNLQGMDKRRFYYHMKNCKSCREDIKEEYIFYATLNDKDSNYDFDINKDIKNKIKALEDDIVVGDKDIYIRYTMISLLITFLLIFTLALAIRLVFNY